LRISTQGRGSHFVRYVNSALTPLGTLALEHRETGLDGLVPKSDLLEPRRPRPICSQGPARSVRGASPCSSTSPCAPRSTASRCTRRHAPERSTSFGREALLRYVLRPPVAQVRVELRRDGLVRIALKRAYADGTIAVDMDPLSLLCRLAASVPAPRLHT